MVVVASVLSGKGIVEVSDGSKVESTVAHQSMDMHLWQSQLQPKNLWRLWSQEALDDPAFLDDSRLLRARADVARQDVLRLASDRVFAAEVTQVAVDEGGLGFAPEGEVIDVRPTEAKSLSGDVPRLATDGDLFWLTTYTCEEGYCGFTASGVQVAAGMAACSMDWAFGTHFLVAERWEVVCQDRGSGVVLPNHLDVYFDTVAEAAAWLAQVGDHAQVEVIE